MGVKFLKLNSVKDMFMTYFRIEAITLIIEKHTYSKIMHLQYFLE